MIFIVIITFLFLTDTAVKFMAEKNLKEHIRIPIFDGKLFLMKHHNEGAFLSFGEHRAKLVKLFSIGLTGICLVIFIFTLGRRGKILLKTGLTFLLGGAFSNTCDRLTRQYVVDYFGFNVKNERFRNIIFNLSDFFILIGSMISVISIPAKKK